MFRTTSRVVAAGVMAFGLLLALSHPTFADDSTLKVKEGDPFPNVAVPATQIDLVKKDGKTLSIEDLKGKIVVVAFYPKALTGG